MEYKGEMLVVLDFLVLDVDFCRLCSGVHLESSETALAREIVDEVIIRGKVVVRYTRLWLAFLVGDVVDQVSLVLEIKSCICIFVFGDKYIINLRLCTHPSEFI